MVASVEAPFATRFKFVELNCNDADSPFSPESFPLNQAHHLMKLLNRIPLTVRLVIMALFALSILGQEGVRADSKTDKPNVIVILTDDQGWGDLSVQADPLLKIADNVVRDTVFDLQESGKKPQDSRYNLWNDQTKLHLWLSGRMTLLIGHADW